MWGGPGKLRKKCQSLARKNSQNEGKTPGAHLLLGMDNDAFAFRPATVVSQDANGRNHQIVIPFNSPVKLVVYSSFLPSFLRWWT